MNNTIGFELTAEEIESIFVQLGFETTKNNNELTVKVPSRRKDITIKEDLIEEIAEFMVMMKYLQHCRYLNM